MAYTYDTDNFTPNFMMLGSSNIKTIDSISGNFKILTCSENNLSTLGSTRFPLGGMPMVWDRLSSGSAILRVINLTGTEELLGDFTSLTDKTVLNGCSVQVATNARNQYLLNMQKFSDLDDISARKATCFSGMDWQMDSNNSLVVNIVTEQPDAYATFMFGNKSLLCGLLRDGWSPIARIDQEVI